MSRESSGPITSGSSKFSSITITRSSKSNPAVRTPFRCWKRSRKKAQDSQKSFTREFPWPAQGLSLVGRGVPSFHAQSMRLGLALVICLGFCSISQAQDVLKNVTFGFGAGFSVPTGATRDHTQTGFNFTASGGPRFDRRLSATLDFMLTYSNLKNTFKDHQTLADPSLGARMRLWSLTVNPNYKFIRREKFGAYFTGGYGLYSRRLLLTTELIPANVCDPFWNVCVMDLPPTVSGRLSTYK